MKNLIFAMFSLTIILSSCSKDENDLKGPTNAQFSYQEENYATPYAYLFIEKTHAIDLSTGVALDEYYNEIVLLLSDQKIILCDNIYLSSNAKHAVYLSTDEGLDDITDLTDLLTNNKIYPLSDDTNIVTQISDFSYEINVDGERYGEPESGFFIPFFEGDTGTLTVNKHSMDWDNLRGTIDIKYTINSSAVGPITGVYQGEITVLLDD